MFSFPSPSCSLDGFLLIITLMYNFAGEIISRLGMICRHNWAEGWMEDLVSPDGTLTE